MPSIKHIAKARQRYEMVPVIDPESGQQKTVPVNRPDGTPKTDKRGNAVTRKVTQADLTKPLPPRRCDYPSCPEPDKVIAIGTAFKCLSIKQQFGGRELFRHETCPAWQPWEYSSSLSARISQIQSYALDSAGWETEDDAKSAAEDAASQIRELSEEKGEAADNMESGFGHETEQSQELRQTADDLESWASEVESALDSVSFPDAEDDNMPTNDEMEQWRDEAQQAIQYALDNSPV
jgi:hypothetical protein